MTEMETPIKIFAYRPSKMSFFLFSLISLGLGIGGLILYYKGLEDSNIKIMFYISMALLVIYSLMSPVMIFSSFFGPGEVQVFEKHFTHPITFQSVPGTLAFNQIKTIDGLYENTNYKFIRIHTKEGKQVNINKSWFGEPENFMAFVRMLPGR